MNATTINIAFLTIDTWALFHYIPRWSPVKPEPFEHLEQVEINQKPLRNVVEQFNHQLDSVINVKARVDG